MRGKVTVMFVKGDIRTRHTLYMPEDEYRNFLRIAERSGMSHAGLIRMWVREGMRRFELPE